MKTGLSIMLAILGSLILIPVMTIVVIALLGTGALVVAFPEVSLPIIGLFIVRSIPVILVGIVIGYNIKK